MTAPVAPTPVTSLGTPPSTADTANFNTRADAFLAALASPFVGQANALGTNVYGNAVLAQTAVVDAQAEVAQTAADRLLTAADAAAAEGWSNTAQGYAASALGAPGTSATSTASISIPGSTPTTVSPNLAQTGKALALGQEVNIARASAPTTRMVGPITAFNSGTGAMSVQVDFTSGSGGPYTDWVISLTGPVGTENSQAEAEAGTSIVPGMSPRRVVQAIAQFASQGPLQFADGSDGNVTISGVVTLSRDMYYDTLTIAAGADLRVNGWTIYCKTKVDLTAAPAGGIKANGSAGGNASTSTAGAAGANATANTVGVGRASQAGTNGTTSTAPAGLVGLAGGNGGAGGGSPAPYAGSGGAGGNVSRPSVASVPFAPRVVRTLLTTTILNPTTLLTGGGGGASGSGGAGDNSSAAGGGGGANGEGGGIVAIYAKEIARGASTAAGAIQANGGSGGNGAAAFNAGTSAGSGGAGGGGGWVYLVCQALSGASAANAVDVSGGGGGAGGAQGTGVSAGDGADAGASGRFTLTELKSASLTENVGGAGVLAGNAKVGTAGGVAKAATSIRYAL